MTTLYWIVEYIRVFIGYMFIMFIWPSVVFKGFLRERTKTFRFAFCVTTMLVLVNTVVLMLGLCHILNPWVIRILFYGMFLWMLLKDVTISRREKRAVKHLLMGTYGVKLFLDNVQNKIKKGIIKCFYRFCEAMKGHWWEYGVLGLVLLYGMIYFTYGAFQDYSYGFGDMYPHSEWIYGLDNGKIFSAGVYPEGMHCFVYAIHTLFGIGIYSSMLFTAGVHILIFMLCAYVMFKEIFRWKYTPMFALMAFLTVDVVCINEIYSMSRLQWTLPQEFGTCTVFLCAAFLLRYAKTKKKILRGTLNPVIYIKKKLNKKVKEPKLSRFYWDENLYVFMMALAASLTIHFYPTIMAFFLCVAFVPVLIHKIFNPRRFCPLVAAVGAGVMIALIPMAGALLSGIPFQGSIGWAVNVINGTDGETSDVDASDTVQQNIGGITITLKKDEEKQEENSGEISVNNSQVQEDGADNVPMDAEEKKAEPVFTRLKKLVKDTADIVYSKSYVTLYRKDRADWILVFTLMACAIWFVSRVILSFVWIILKIFRRKNSEKIKVSCFDHYLSFAIGTVIYMMLYCASSLGFPTLIAGSRLCSITQLLILGMMMIPFDFIFTILHLFVTEKFLKVFSAYCVMGIYVGTMLTGTFHGFLYFELTRYNAAVMCTKKITETLPQNTYTIVSTTDELYQLIQYGRHEELSNFANESIKGDYTLPTEYIFLYVEKKPLQYAQSHFFEGPDWLAQEKYADYYNSYVSQCPDINASEISTKISDNAPDSFAITAKTYSRLESRTQVESRINEWIKDFEKLYPGEMHTYYEDDDFACYYFRQDTSKLYELGIWEERLNMGDE